MGMLGKEKNGVRGMFGVIYSNETEPNSCVVSSCCKKLSPLEGQVIPVILFALVGLI